MDPRPDHTAGGGAVSGRDEEPGGGRTGLGLYALPAPAVDDRGGHGRGGHAGQSGLWGGPGVKSDAVYKRPCKSGDGWEGIPVSVLRQRSGGEF